MTKQLALLKASLTGLGVASNTCCHLASVTTAYLQRDLHSLCFHYEMKCRMTICHSDDAGDERSKKPGGASNLAAGEQLLSGVLINMEEEAHVVIAIPQDDATDYMQQSSEQPTNQPTQSESNQHSDHADLLRSAVQPPPDADGILQTEEKDESQVPSDHVSVLHKERDHQQGKKTVFITVSPRGSIKVTSSNSQLTVRPDFSKNGG